MPWNWIYATVLTLLIACLLWLLLERLHAAAPGDQTRLTLTISAAGDAPELEMQLRDLIWLRQNHILQADLQILDAGLTPEASRRARKLCEQYEIIFNERK